MRSFIVIFIILLLIAGCSSLPNHAPIVNANDASIAKFTESTNAVENPSQNSQAHINTLNDADASDFWIMPVTINPNHSRAITKFKKNSGINILGAINEDIFASNNGKILYSGNGIKGYGNLIIIKHSNDYISAYAYNKINLVQEGDLVKRGDKIAKMGLGPRGQPILHFEIRKNGKNIDPSTLIQSITR